MFQGFIDEGVAATILVLLRGSSGQPVEPDAAPTWRLFGVNGVVSGGTGSASSFESGSVTGATNASPIVLTAAAHGLSAGTQVTVTGVGGNTAANGTFTITAPSSGTIGLVGSTGNGSYTSGGAWKTTGLYKVVLTGSVLNSLEAGKTYTLVVYWLESGSRRAETITFTVR